MKRRKMPCFVLSCSCCWHWNCDGSSTRISFFSSMSVYWFRVGIIWSCKYLRGRLEGRCGGGWDVVGLEGEARLVGCGGVWWGVFSSVVYLI